MQVFWQTDGNNVTVAKADAEQSRQAARYAAGCVGLDKQGSERPAGTGKLPICCFDEARKGLFTVMSLFVFVLKLSNRLLCGFAMGFVSRLARQYGSVRFQRLRLATGGFQCPAA